MKLRFIFTLTFCSALLLISCSTTTVIPGFERTIFIDYSLFTKNGVEVSDTDVPNDCTAIGQLTEIIRFPRVYKEQTISIPSTPTDDDMFSSRSKTILTSNRDLDSDVKSITEKITTIVKNRNGKGIAKLNVSVTNAHPQPTFYVSGIIYK